MGKYTTFVLLKWDLSFTGISTVLSPNNIQKKELYTPSRTVSTNICGGSSLHKITYLVCVLKEIHSYIVALLYYVLYLSRGIMDRLKMQTSKTIKITCTHAGGALSSLYFYVYEHLDIILHNIRYIGTTNF
jgi:hypothetical protein